MVGIPIIPNRVYVFELLKRDMETKNYIFVDRNIIIQFTIYIENTWIAINNN